MTVAEGAGHPTTLGARLRAAANRLLQPVGFFLARPHELAHANPSRWTMRAALVRAASLGIQPASLIDIGAAEGRWACEAMSVFPAAAVALVEPLAERHATLEELCRRFPQAVLEGAAVGAISGQVEFNVSPDLDGSGVYGADGGGELRRVPQVTVDALVARHQLRGPYLLKLDTHGYELPIFEGAAATLAQTELIIVEAYGFRLAPTAVRFWELCAWLETKGFRCADVVDPMGRERDGLFWQADFLFLRGDHRSFRHEQYR